MQRLLPLVVAVVLTSAAGAPPADPAARILDATPEYCRSLAGRLAAIPAARAEPSRTLGAEGVKLCGDGHVRTGVTKLRRAIRAARAQTVPAAVSTAGVSAEAQGVTR